jgi:hypothetical protein
MRYKDNWDETKERFDGWWKGKNSGRPLMHIEAIRNKPLEALEAVANPDTPEKFHTDVEVNAAIYRNYCRTHKFMAEAFPNFSVDLGPGSLALYLGGEPKFAWDTVWYKECIHECDEFGKLEYKSDNDWWRKHQDLISRAKILSSNDFLVNIPDIIENLDILAALRGPQDLIYDMMDNPDRIKKSVERLDELYFKYYNALYDLIKDDDGSSSYTCFQIWGRGKTAKIQCDFSALISPAQFRDFVQESLRKQCKLLDNSLYHLDGPGAIKHLDALMEIEELKALQWTCGAGQSDGSCESWYPIYDKVRASGKSLWIQLYDGNLKEWIEGAERLVKRYGTEGLFLIFPEMDEVSAAELLEYAEKGWR